MSTASVIDALFNEVSPAMRDALQRAYELGYREALASAPAPTGATAGADVTRLASEAPPSLEVASPQPTILDWDQDSVEDDDDENDAPGADGAPKPRRRRRVGILASSTVGALEAKIRKEFRLERFDIEVLIVRAGDKERRRLSSNVRLGAYAVEE